MSEVTRYAVIETALCIGSNLMDGEVFMVMATDHDRELAALREELESERTLRRNHAARIHELSDQTKDIQQRLTAAEQRNAELVELLDSAFFRLDTFIEAEREMPIPSMEVLRDAILRHCPDLKLTDSGASE